MYEPGLHTHPCGAPALMGKSVHFDIGLGLKGIYVGVSKT